ncbi:Multidrug resistance-associated protein 4 [Dinochytrium kinnereticum]|nr:Multidrug resistance-associated protein 4 [Dinochytrium kinnereticum]
MGGMRIALSVMAADASEAKEAARTEKTVNIFRISVANGYLLEQIDTRLNASPTERIASHRIAGADALTHIAVRFHRIAGDRPHLEMDAEATKEAAQGPPSPSPNKPRLTRRQDASFFSKYVNELISRGCRNTLTESDWPLNNEADDASKLSTRLLQLWKQEQEAKGPKASLVNVTARMFVMPLIGAGVWFLLEELLKLVNAILLGYLLKWFGDDQADIRTGFEFALLLSLSTILIAFIHHINFWIAMRMGLQLRVAFIAAIYKKWISPALLIIVGGLMYLQIDNATFVAIGALIFLIPVQGYIAQWFGKYRRGSVVPRDSRLKTISDMLNGIMVVKLYAWEKPLIDVVAALRGKEMDYVGLCSDITIQRASILRAINEGFFFASSAILEIFAFGAYFFMGGVLTPSKVFTTISLLSTVRLNMGSRFPKVLQFIAEALVSFRRIQNFLSLPEISQSQDPAIETAVLRDSGDGKAMVFMKGCSFRWGGGSAISVEDALESGGKIRREKEGEAGAEQERKIVLQDLDVLLRDGELTAVVGTVGAGKSSFLNAILGEMEQTTTTPDPQMALRTRNIAYASQTPWILSDTIRNNILFGRPYRADWFATVIEACALERDVKLFSEGVETVVGERGVTLSGGQKARVALARAVYAEAELYLLDDPLSAVDAKVGRHIFDKCINGLLRNKCRVLVTHQLQYVIDCNSVILLDNGKMPTPLGSFKSVMTSTSSDFTAVMREHANRPEDLGETVDDGLKAKKKVEKFEKKDSLNEKSPDEEEEEQQPEKHREIKKEEAAQGDVPLSLYRDYFRSGAFSRMTLPILVVAIVLGQALLVVTDYWLGRWASVSAEQQKEVGYPAGFFSLAVATVGVSMARAVMFFMVCVKASRVLSRKMLMSVFSAPLQFFVENPSGRVMNRMSTDLNRMDESLPWTFFDFIQCLFLVIGTLAVAVVVIPYVLLLVPVIGVFFWYLRKNYLQASRQVKREEAITRSPVYSNIPATLEGLSIVRAFGAETRFLTRFSELQNSNTRIAVCFLSAVRWLGLRLDLISALFLIVVAFLSVVVKNRPGLNLSASTVGLVLSYALQLMGLLQWCFRQSAEVENLMTATERVIEYTDLPTEFKPLPPTNPPLTIDATPQVSTTSLVRKKPSTAAILLEDMARGTAPDGWPSTGEVEIRGLTMTYPNAERNALDGVSVRIPAGSRVGIVGRTGAGKSSLLQALFRLVEHSGLILIDGIDTTSLTLTELRSKISIIPQDPFCFRGTLRFNLDPFKKFTDAELWYVLEKVRLKPVVEALSEKLDAPVTENGSNWSVGERQLICLARAILRSSKLFVMDEATSAIDLSTDAFLASVLRAEEGPFANATILTIAHRLNTIIDYDYVMVMDEGKLVEFGRPHDLLSKPSGDSNSWFSSMVSEMASDAQNLLREIAFNKHLEGVQKRKED